MKIKIMTKYPIATASPDFKIQQEELILPCSAGEDNSTSLKLIDKIGEHYAKTIGVDKNDLRLNCLDLGCGGGQLIVDLNKQSFTDTCIGLDGIAGTIGWPNWLTYPNNFYNVDLSKEYTILNAQTSEPMQFDLITSWEMIEHLHPQDIDIFFKTLHKHLSPTGMFIGSIAMFPDTRDTNGFYEGHPHHDPTTEQFVLHQTVMSREEWRETLKDYNLHEYPFKDSRYKCGYLATRDHPDSPTGLLGSFYLMITK